MRSAWALALALLLVLAPVFAANATGISVSGKEEKGQYPVTTENNVNGIQAGYVYKVDLELVKVAGWWAGIYGTITSAIVLGDSEGKKFFEWPLSLPSYIAITYSTDINWDSLAATTASEFNAILHSELRGWNPSSDESVENTFNESHECIKGKTTISAKVYGDYDKNDDITKEWPVCAYAAKDSGSSDRAVYVAMVEKGGKAYNGEEADYQAIIAATESGVTIHFWKVEFS